MLTCKVKTAITGSKLCFWTNACGNNATSASCGGVLCQPHSVLRAFAVNENWQEDFVWSYLCVFLLVLSTQKLIRPQFEIWRSTVGVQSFAWIRIIALWFTKDTHLCLFSNNRPCSKLRYSDTFLLNPMTHHRSRFLKAATEINWHTRLKGKPRAAKC